MDVRDATRNDESAIFDLLVAMHRHNGAGWGYPYDPSTIVAQIQVGTRQIFADRTNPRDQRWGKIGVIGPEGETLMASVGLFLDRAAWYTRESSLFELWLFVRPEARDYRQYENALFDYSVAFHEEIKAKVREHGGMLPVELQTGFVHRGKRFAAMSRLWRMKSGATPIGMLFSRR